MQVVVIVNAAWLAFIATCGAATPLLPVAEHEVIEAFLGDEGTIYGARDVALFDVACAANLDLNSSYERAQKGVRLVGLDRGPAFREAVEDALNKSQTAARVAAVTNASRRVHLVPEGEFKGLFSDSDETVDDWLRFYEKFPNCSRVVITSRVGFDRSATLAVLFYSLKEPSPPGATRLEVFRRAGERWKISDIAVAARQRGTNLLALTCQLRYFVAASPGSDLAALKLEVAENQGTNLVCSVPRPFKLASSPPGWDSVGWVLQIEAPAAFAGCLLTAMQDDYPPADIFRFGRLYEVSVQRDLIGDLSFRLRF